MTDTLTAAERSVLMAKVRGTGNRSTEGLVEAVLVAEKIRGWKKHPDHVPGKPDFYFPRYRLAVFVDGCFWHACPRCGRIPKSNTQFWTTKIEQNRCRDNRVRRQLRKLGYHAMRIWEHEVAGDRWLPRLRRTIMVLRAALQSSRDAERQSHQDLTRPPRGRASRQTTAASDSRLLRSPRRV